MTAESDKAKKKRLTFEYSEQTSTRLNEMQIELGLTSPIEVIRIAVKLLSYLLRQTNDGWEIILRKDGLEKSVVPEAVPEPSAQQESRSNPAILQVDQDHQLGGSPLESQEKK